LEFDHLLRQLEQGGHAQALAGLAEGRTPWGALAAERLQPFEDLAVAVAAEQTQGDDEPDHEPGGQAQVASAGMTGAAQDSLDLGARDEAFEGAKAFGGGPLRQRGRLGV
jgi:hypothetical protein